MLMHNPTVGTFAGSIVEPIDVLTMDLRIPMGDILRIPMEDILLTPMGGMEWATEAMEWALEWAMEAMEAMEDIIVHPISAEGLCTNTVVGTMGVLTASATGVRL
jgi:hypothetical protein